MWLGGFLCILPENRQVRLMIVHALVWECGGPFLGRLLRWGPASDSSTLQVCPVKLNGQIFSDFEIKKKT